MANTIIINLMSALGIGDDKLRYINDVKEEYLEIKNNSIYIFIVLLFHNVSSRKKELIIQKKNKDKFEDVHLDVDNIDLGNINTLVQIFSQILTPKQLKIENKVLVLWGHGMGYSMFSAIQTGNRFRNLKLITPKRFLAIKEEAVQDVKIKRKVTPPFFSDYAFVRYYNLPKDNPEPETRITALTINELSASIRSAGISFDLIVLDNCFMQTVDTFYALKDNTRYLIAPQTGFPWRGFDYSQFNVLSGKIDDAFCTKFCEASFETLQETNGLPAFANDLKSSSIVFSCIKTENAAAFFESLFKIIDFYKQNYDIEEADISNSLYNAVFRCTDLTKDSFTGGLGLSLIDLKFFLTQYNERAQKNPAFEKPFRKLLELYPTIIFGPFVGERHKKESGGLSIFFPFSQDEKEKSPYNEFFEKEGALVQSGFSIKSGWGVFLDDYFDIIEPEPTP